MQPPSQVLFPERTLGTRLRNWSSGDWPEVEKASPEFRPESARTRKRNEPSLRRVRWGDNLITGVCFYYWRENGHDKTRFLNSSPGQERRVRKIKSGLESRSLKMTTAKFIVKRRKALQLQQACANPRECARVKEIRQTPSQSMRRTM